VVRSGDNGDGFDYYKKMGSDAQLAELDG
jgi:hypothetical protein